jgi:hypothetical protein
MSANEMWNFGINAMFVLMKGTKRIQLPNFIGSAGIVVEGTKEEVLTKLTLTKGW